MNGRSVPRETCILRRFLRVLPAGFSFLLFLHRYTSAPNNISLLRRLNVSLILAHRLQRVHCLSVLKSLLISLDMAPSPGRRKKIIFLLLLFEVFKSVKYEKSSHVTTPRINKNNNFTEVYLMQKFTFILWRFSELHALKVHRSGLKCIRTIKNNWK